MKSNDAVYAMRVYRYRPLEITHAIPNMLVDECLSSGMYRYDKDWVQRDLMINVQGVQWAESLLLIANNYLKQFYCVESLVLKELVVHQVRGPIIAHRDKLCHEMVLIPVWPDRAWLKVVGWTTKLVRGYVYVFDDYKRHSLVAHEEAMNYFITARAVGQDGDELGAPNIRAPLANKERRALDTQ